MIATEPRLPQNGPVALLRSAPSHAIALTGNRRLLVYPNSGVQLICGEPEYRLLLALARFRHPLDHADVLRREFPPLREIPTSALLDIIAGFHTSGAMLSVDDILHACSTASPSAPPVEWLAIPTSNRNAQLRRALDSFQTNAALFSRQYQILVADQSDEIIQFGGMAVYHAGLRAVSNYAKKIAERSGAPLEIVRIALTGFGDRSIAPGANRNVILLQTTGSLFVSVDDDTVCQTAITPGASTAGLAVRGHDDPHRIIPFIDRAAALDSVRFEPRDWVADHERLLGRSPSSIVRAFSMDRIPDMDAMCPHVYDALMTGRGHIAMTLSGSVGDSGMHTRAPFLVHPGLSNPAGPSLFGLHNAREILRATSEFSISHGFGSAQTMFAGFDNREILPPFFPLLPERRWRLCRHCFAVRERRLFRPSTVGHAAPS